MTQIDPRIRVCGVCATILDYLDGAGPDGQPGFAHHAGVQRSGGDDHPVVPVLPGEVYAITFCDLCYEPDPGFILPARDFVYPGGTDGSSGMWSICKACAALVGTNRWNEIVRRNAAGFYARHGQRLDDVQTAYLKKIHRLLRQNITGSPWPGKLPTPADRGDTP